MLLLFPELHPTQAAVSALRPPQNGLRLQEPACVSRGHQHMPGKNGAAVTRVPPHQDSTPSKQHSSAQWAPLKVVSGGVISQLPLVTCHTRAHTGSCRVRQLHALSPLLTAFLLSLSHSPDLVEVELAAPTEKERRGGQRGRREGGCVGARGASPCCAHACAASQPGHSTWVHKQLVGHEGASRGGSSVTCATTNLQPPRSRWGRPCACPG